MKQKQRSQKKIISRCAQPSSQKNAEPKTEGREEVPFWKRKTLRSLTKDEWESLCDGCGRCCLIKLEDEDNGDIHFTDIACRLFKAESCSCSHYRERQKKVSDCLKLTPKIVGGLSWLPPTCAYRLMEEGRDLYWWHPLVSGSKETVHQAGISVRGRVSYLEGEIEIDDYPARIVSWPGQPEG